MIRAPMGNRKYWSEWSKFRLKTIEDEKRIFETPSANPVYRPQYILNNLHNRIEYIISLYSDGTPIQHLSQYFEEVLDTWELSNRLSDEICKERGLESCRSWDFSLSNLNHYNWCFWLVGLALSLEISNDQWQRLLTLIDGEGEDELLDRVIASRSPNRRIGTALLHAKPYGRLLKAVDAPKKKQAALLRDFVDHWYIELKRPTPKDHRTSPTQPFWYFYGDPKKSPLEMGHYFGRWCIEAVAAVKAFGLDDSLCLGHEHYPGDLLRPDRPTTHPVRNEPKTVRGWFAKLFNKNLE